MPSLTAAATPSLSMHRLHPEKPPRQQEEEQNQARKPAQQPLAPPAAAAAACEQLYSIIIPTYNEADNLPLLLVLLHRACSAARIAYEVVVVDDASPDGTAQVAAALRGVLGGARLTVASRASKLGLGSAYAHGLAHARGAWVVLMDADLSHHPKYIPQLVAAQAAARADVVASSRYRAGGGVAGWGLGRKLTSRGANVLASTLLGAAASDLTGAYRLYRRSLLEAVLPTVHTRGYAFQMEMLVRSQAAGAVIAEVPIVFVDRLYGTSKLGAAEFAEFALGLLRLLLTL